MTKYKAIIKYDGSKFCGFQKLKKEKTVQGELEKKLSKIDNSNVFVKGAGRTDKGAHALHQVVHFSLKNNIPEDRLKNALNNSLDDYIFALEIIKVERSFHSRFDAKLKTYKYIINMGEYDPLKDDYLLNYNKKLKVNKMKRAAKYLVKQTSFKGYVTGKRNNYDTKICKIKIKKQKKILTITVKGETFYNHMIRNIIGALVFVGEEKIKPISIKEMLDMGENIYNYPTMPACGLYLVNIKY